MIDLKSLDVATLQANAAQAAALMRALSNRHRLMVLCRLGDGECAVSDLRTEAGLSQSALSQHLAVLREDGLVATRREGTSIFYRIADPAALKVIAVLIEIYCPKEA